MIQTARLIEGAKHAETLNSQRRFELYTLEILPEGVRCRAVYRKGEQKYLMQYHINWPVLETAHANPIVEALNLCARNLAVEVSDTRLAQRQG